MATPSHHETLDDLNGDGRPEWLACRPEEDRCAVHLSPVTVDAPDATFVPWGGVSVRVVGDLDGDGERELVLSHRDDDLAHPNAGAVRFFSADQVRGLEPDAAWLTVHGTWGGTEEVHRGDTAYGDVIMEEAAIGEGLALSSGVPDYDGDGLPELLFTGLTSLERKGVTYLVGPFCQ